jgi:ornithine carbamoyltransferase
MSSTTITEPLHLLKDSDLSARRLQELLGLAAVLKTARGSGTEVPLLRGKTFALLFEKPSTRTRCAFEVACYELGAHCTYIDPASSHLGVTESIEDTARVLAGYYSGIAFRGFAQDSVESLARSAGVPVWNALTDVWHPTQALADLLTIQEHRHSDAERPSVCFVGDGNDNVVHSLLVAGALLGLDIRVACPSVLRPQPGIVLAARERAAHSGGSILVTDDVDAAIAGVDFLYTDVWVSMGESAELLRERIRLLAPYRVDRSVVDRTGNPDVKFLHCLPAVHDRETKVGAEVFAKGGLDGAEVTDDVFQSAHSLVFEQAENRLHTIKAVMLQSLAQGDPTTGES